MRNFLNELKYANRNMSTITKIILGVIVLYMLLTIKHSDIFSIPFLISIVVLLTSISLHEMAHGFAAYLLGDNTAKSYGRISLNPLHHIDPLGLLFPILMAIIHSPFLIGWAKPVPIDYSRLKYGRFGEFIVAIAGILINFLILIAACIVLKLFYGKINSFYFGYTIAAIYKINILLIVLNLLPVPPLDGSKILAAIAPQSLREMIFYLDRFGILIIILLGWSGILDDAIWTGVKFFNTIINYIW